MFFFFSVFVKMMMCFVLLQFLNVEDFSSVKPTLLSSDEPHLVLIYFYVLLDSNCFYVFRILASILIYRIACDFPFLYCPCWVLLSQLHKMSWERDFSLTLFSEEFLCWYYLFLELLLDFELQRFRNGGDLRGQLKHCSTEAENEVLRPQSRGRLLWYHA